MKKDTEDVTQPWKGPHLGGQEKEEECNEQCEAETELDLIGERPVDGNYSLEHHANEESYKRN